MQIYFIYLSSLISLINASCYINIIDAHYVKENNIIFNIKDEASRDCNGKLTCTILKREEDSLRTQHERHRPNKVVIKYTCDLAVTANPVSDNVIINHFYLSSSINEPTRLRVNKIISNSTQDIKISCKENPKNENYNSIKANICCCLFGSIIVVGILFYQTGFAIF